MSLFSKLKRRNVLRAGAAYIVAAWLIIQVIETIFPAFGFGNSVVRIAVIALAIGFFPVLILAWAFELTPEGLKREKDVDYSSSAFRQFGKRIDRAIILVLVVALTYFAFDKYVLEPTRDSDLITTTTMQVEQAVLNRIPEKSIAVLPFVNMSSDPEQEYFSDGLSEDLLNLLADIEELKVAARTSSFFYKNKLEEIPLRLVAQQLGVAHILEGSVRRGGNKIRITAQLIRADNGYHLWSETYDRELDDVFAIQDEISAAVVDALKLELLGEAPHARVIDTESWELTLQGRYLYNRRAEGDWQRSFELFDRALELDGQNSHAWIGIAPLYSYLFGQVENFTAAIEKTLELDPGNPEALMRRAMILNWTGNKDEAREARERALQAGPNHPFVLMMMSDFAEDEGNDKQALSYQRRAVAVDPLDPLNLGKLAFLLIKTDRLDEAEKYAMKAFDLSPVALLSQESLAAVRLFQGRGEEVVKLAQEMPGDFVKHTSGIPRLLWTALGYHTMGNQARADEALLVFKERVGQQMPSDVAMIHAWRGETELAFEWIDRTFKMYPDVSVGKFKEPYWKNLYEDPRWAAVMSRYNQETD